MTSMKHLREGSTVLQQGTKVRSAQTLDTIITIEVIRPRGAARTLRKDFLKQEAKKQL